MPEENLSLLDWIKQEWSTPLWRRTVRLMAAGVLALLGALSLLIAFETGNGFLLLAAAFVLLILGLRIDVPEKSLPVVLEDGRVEPPTSPSAPQPEAGNLIPPAATPESPPVRILSFVQLLSFVRLPLAACFAVLAQYVLDQRPLSTDVDASFAPGLFLYAVAMIFAVWGLLAGDFPFSISSTTGQGNGFQPTRQRLLLFTGAAVFGLLAYATFTGGMFNWVSIILLLVALLYWTFAVSRYEGGLFDAILSAARAVGSKIRSAAGAIRHGITFSPWTLLVTVCFLALVAFRTHNLAGIPPGMTDDHAEKLLNVIDILEGRPYIFFANNGGRESLEFYLVALLVQVAGTGISFLSLKIISISVGIAVLPVMYLLGRELADRRVGLLAMLFVGFGYWPDMISRIGLRLPNAMLFTGLTLFFFLRALRRRRWNDFLWSGIMLGIGLYGYTPIRIVPLVMAAALGLFLLHPSAKGSRLWAAAGSIVSILTAGLLFIPMLRYALEFPNDFWLRTVSRVVPEGGTLLNPIGVFWENLKHGMLLFNWDDGGGWFNCVPLRPALDIVTGALFALGFFLLLAHFFRRRAWESLFLIIAIPLLILPSVLALAEPINNPSLARANAVIPIAFLLPAIGLAGILDYLKARISGWTGSLAGGIVAVVILIPVIAQNFNLTQVQYPQVYRSSAQNESEIGVLIKDFALSIGRYDDAHFVPYPYWVGDRLVNLYAGLPINHTGLVVWKEEIAAFPFSGRPTLFLLMAQDEESLQALQMKFPDGTWKYFASSFPGKDYIAFLVPGTPGEQAAP